MKHGGKRNGAGRPKGSKAPHTLEIAKAKEYLIQEVVREIEAILRPQIEKAKQGDSSAFQRLLDRTFGRPKEVVDSNEKITLVVDI